MAYKIREIRKQMNMTQTQLAEQAGVSRQVINGLESKRETVTTTTTLSKIANVFGCSVASLFSE